MLPLVAAARNPGTTCPVDTSSRVTWLWAWPSTWVKVPET